MAANKPYQDEYQPFALHPYKVYLFLLLASLTVLFLAFSVGYVFTRNAHGAEGIQMPLVFIFNTVLLLGSSLTMRWANRAYKADNTQAYQQALMVTLGLTVLFMAAQALGWYEMTQTVFAKDIGNAKDYLYAISGLHFAHVVGGIPFLGMFWWAARKRMKEPVSVLIYFSDPEKRLKLNLLTIYWHFLDGLWIFLVIFFLVNALV